jgi:NDP-sugar pyrophosphorylase family protein
VGLLDANIAGWPASPLGRVAYGEPWEITAAALDILRRLLPLLGADYACSDEVAVHRSASVEGGASLKGPLIVGPGCFIAGGALLRGGCWLEAACMLGPGTELKSSFLFGRTRLAHFNFVGDSILGTDVNLEAGAVIANHRNELPDPTIAIAHQGRVIATGAQKFGALVGDGARIGANAVIAPGAILEPGTRIGRLALVDQSPGAGGRN